MDLYQCFISFALTINTLTPIFSLETFRHRDIIAAWDWSGKIEPIIDFFDKKIVPILKRLSFFEVIACIWLISMFDSKPSFYNDVTRFLLFIPQIIFFSFIILIELVLFIILCWKGSFRNNRPYWIGLIEFIFLFCIFGFFDLCLPTLFDFTGKFAFKNAKPRGPIKNGDGDNSETKSKDDYL